MAEFLEDKNVNIGAGLGLGDLSKGKGLLGKEISTSINKSFDEMQAGFVSFRQDTIATDVVTKYRDEVNRVTNGELGAIQGGVVQALNPSIVPSLSNLVFGNPVDKVVEDYDAKIKALHEKHKGAFDLKTTEQLRADFIKEKDRQFEGDPNFKKGAISSFIGGALGVLADPLGIATLGVAKGISAFKAGATFAEKTFRLGLHGLFGEAVIQANTTQSKEDRILGLALAPLGGAAVMGFGKVLSAVASQAYPTVKKATAKTLNYAISKTGNLSENLASTLNKVGDQIPDPILSLKFKSQANMLNLYKGTLNDALDMADNSLHKFQSYQTLGKVNQNIQVIEPKFRNPSKLTKDVMDELQQSGTPVTKENFEASLIKRAKEDNLPVTISGKHSTYFETVVEKVRDSKGKLREKNISKPLEFETKAEAQLKINRLNEEAPFKHNLYIHQKENGKFTLLKDNSIEALPHSRSYATRELAQADIERMAQITGIPINEIKVLKGNFYNPKKNITGTTYRLATGYDEHDLASIKANELFSAEPAQVRLKTSLEEAPLQPLRSEKLAQQLDERLPITKQEVEQIVGQIMDDDNIHFQIPHYKNKKAFQDHITKTQKFLADFESCIGK